MSNLIRRYALASFVGALIAVVLLAGFYRNIEIRETTELAQKNSLTLTEAVLDFAGPDLDEYLESVNRLGPMELSDVPFPAPLAAAISEFAQKLSIAKVRIYSAQGVIVYSTDRRELGVIDAGNSGFVAASNGQALGDLSYRDAFSDVGRPADGDNLARTFLPVRRSPAAPVAGALATYVDLNPMLAQNKQELLQVIGGIVLIMALLYSALLFVVMRAKKVFDVQQETIRERTTTLETLSVQLIAGQEAEKAHLALELHDGLAQTLSAIKSRIQHRLEQLPADAARNDSLSATVSALQGAIEEVQEMAIGLRPPSLDQLGLLPTICWYCREFEYLHPDIRIEQQITAIEDEIPEPLKIVIYRIIETVLEDIGKNGESDQIRISLQPQAKEIILAIDDIPHSAAPIAAMAGEPAALPRVRFAAAQERATLSGGAFRAAFNREGGVTLHASWGM